MRTCNNCGAQIDNDALFCTECGTKQEPQKKICTQCGAEIDDDSIFCAECGTKLDAVTTPTVEQPQVDAPIEEAKVEPVVKPPVSEQPLVEQQTTEQAKDTNVKTTDIEFAPKTNSNSWKYIIGGVVCAVLVVAGGWFVYDKHFGSVLDKLDFSTPLTSIRVSVSEAYLYTEPDENSPVAKTKDGDDWIVKEGYIYSVIEDCGEWYKIVPGYVEYKEFYIKKTDCSESSRTPIQDTNANYLTIDNSIIGSSYIVHRSVEKELVLEHVISPNGEEKLYLGTVYNGFYVYNYSANIDKDYWSEYRKTITTDNGSVSMIDFNQIPEKHLTDPFEEKIRKHERCFHLLEDSYLEIFRFRKININTINSFNNADHPFLDGNIAGKYDFVMFLDVFGDRVEGRYRVLQNQDGFVNLSGSITMGKVEVYEYNKDGSQTGYYFSGTLNDKGFSGKYLSTENKKLKMSFTSKVK